VKFEAANWSGLGFGPMSFPGIIGDQVGAYTADDYGSSGGPMRIDFIVVRDGATVATFETQDSAPSGSYPSGEVKLELSIVKIATN
jgi:hypothetical protein